MANSKASAGSSAARPAALPDADSGVTQPAASLGEANDGKAVPSLHLGELNMRSAKLGCWDVGIFQPRIEEWSYKERSTGKPKNGAAFRCLLVSASNPSQYVIGQTLMGGSIALLKAALQRFLENKYFRKKKTRSKISTNKWSPFICRDFEYPRFKFFFL